MTVDASSPRSVWPLAAVLTTVAWSLSGAASVFVGMMSVMLFDAPGSEEDARVWAVALSVWSYPVLCLLSIIGGWVTWFVTRRWEAARARRGRFVRLAVAGLPFLSIVAFAISFAFLAASGS
jgi:hypothetical protein